MSAYKIRILQPLMDKTLMRKVVADLRASLAKRPDTRAMLQADLTSRLDNSIGPGWNISVVVIGVVWCGPGVWVVTVGLLVIQCRLEMINTLAEWAGRSTAKYFLCTSDVDLLNIGKGTKQARDKIRPHVPWQNVGWNAP